MKRVRSHPAAMAEFEAAFDWYLDRSPAAAAEFAAEMTRAIARIARAPLLFAEGQCRTRRYNFHHFPYSVVYLDDPSMVQIAAVMHSRRRPEYWKTRL